MADKPFGVILREARERQGLSLDDASRYLRIRADILGVIEQCDFDHMPARGYARNMVGAYARMLGLNAPAITRQYIQEIDNYQMGVHEQDEMMSFRHSQYSNGTSSNNDSFAGSSRSRNSRNNRNTSQNARRESERLGSKSRSPRSFYMQNERLRREMSQSQMSGENKQNGRRSYRYSGNSQSHRQSSRRSNPQRNPLMDSESMQTYGGRASRNGGPREQSQQAGLLTSIFSSNFTSKLPLIIAVVFVIALLIFAITHIVSCVSPKQTTTNTNVPITGVSDTTSQNTNSNANNTNTTATAPTSCTVTYTVDSGTEIWIEIYENDSTTPSVAEIVTGPSTSAFTVTGKWKISVPVNSGIKVSVDGSEVELTSDGSGYYSYTVDFAKVLNEWAQKNKTGNTSNTNSPSNTNTTSNTSNTNNTNSNSNSTSS